MAKVTYQGHETRNPLPGLPDMLGQLVMCGETSDIYIVGKVPNGYVKVNLSTGVYWAPPTLDVPTFWQNVNAILPEGAVVKLVQE